MIARELWLPVASAVVLVPCVAAYRRWAARRRFGSPRLVPAGRDPLPGETLQATLEAAPHLAQAREVRFELVELDRSGGGRYRRQVRGTAQVSFSAFQIVPDLARIPVSLTVPADARPSLTERKLGFSWSSELFIGMRETEHAWEVRATAEVEGIVYRGSFRVTVAAAASAPGAAEAPYRPRPIVIPPSDKVRA